MLYDSMILNVEVQAGVYRVSRCVPGQGSQWSAPTPHLVIEVLHLHEVAVLLLIVLQLLAQPVVLLLQGFQ